jgi:hypothetical protein
VTASTWLVIDLALAVARASVSVAWPWWPFRLTWALGAVWFGVLAGYQYAHVVVAP